MLMVRLVVISVVKFRLGVGEFKLAHVDLLWDCTGRPIQY